MYIHHCPECGKQYSTQDQVSRVKCPYCGAETSVAYSEQPNQQQPPQFGYQQPNQASTGNIFDEGPSGKSRGLAGLLAILLGSLGVHYFYMGKNTGGIVFLLVSILSCGCLAPVTGIIALIQGIMFFTTSQQEFERKWVNYVSDIPLF